jgi:hypothetical protein
MAMPFLVRPAQHRTAWEPSSSPVQFALLELETVDAAIRSHPLRSICFRCTLSPNRGLCRPGTTRLLPAWRRLSAPWMLTLLVPSFHVGTGKAFTENNPPSDALPSLRSTGCRLLSFPTTSFGLVRHSGACEVQFAPREPESSHRPLAIEEPPSRAGWPVTRRWRNDSERLSSRQLPCEPPLIRTPFQPRGPDALRRPTKPRTMPPL